MAEKDKLTERKVTALCFGFLILVTVATWALSRSPGVAPGASALEKEVERAAVGAAVAPPSPERVQGSGLGEAFASPIDAHANHQLVVSCHSQSGDALQGIEICIRDASGVRRVGQAITDEGGRATIQLPVGDYAVSARDPKKTWTCLYGEGILARKVSVLRDTSAELVFEEVYVADVEFVGDEILFVSTGRHSVGLAPALDLQLADDPTVDGQGLRRLNCDPQPTSYTYYFSHGTASSGSSLFVRVYTSRRGRVEVEVPVVSVRNRSMMRVDLSQRPEAPSSKVTVIVLDMNGLPADIGSVRLQSLSDFVLCLDCRSNLPRSVPGNQTYRVRLGEFPLTWKFPDLKSLTIGGDGHPHTMTLNLTWPVLRRRIRLTLSGESIPADEVVRCTVTGDFGANCVGANNYPLMGGSIPLATYPVGSVGFQVTARGRVWSGRADLTVNADEVVVDLK